MLTAVFSDISIIINRKKYDIHPTIIDDVSYFPIRTIGYMLNCAMELIPSLKQIVLTSQSEQVSENNFKQRNGTATAIFDDNNSSL